MSDQHNQILNTWARPNRGNMSVQNNRSNGLDKILNRDDREYVEALIAVLYNFEPNNNNLAVRDNFSYQTWHLALENFVSPIRENHFRALSNVMHKTNGYRPIKDIAVYPPSGNSPCRLVVEFVPYASVEGMTMVNSTTTTEQNYFNSPMPPPSRPIHYPHQPPPPEEQYYRHRSRSRSPPPRTSYKPYNRSPSIERSDSRSRSRSQSPVHTSSTSKNKRKKEGSRKEKTKSDSVHRKSSSSSSTSNKKRKTKKEPQEPERGRSSSVIGRLFGGQ